MNEKDMFVTIFRMQRELMKVIESRNGSTGSITELILAMLVEGAEFANEDGSFKFWKQNHKKDSNAIKEELIDILFFWVQLVVKIGFEPEEMFKAYVEKWDINIKRQRQNY